MVDWGRRPEFCQAKTFGENGPLGVHAQGLAADAGQFELGLRHKTELTDFEDTIPN
jgi:hypothetical protein